ncbi:hypothetical protein BCR34DRAFT_341271 [Clohesyomyces aquaticus]|uniref:Secreted protein n=1 Tax=Clohesyomyces aquaticus TaxID=1231657 RepID=A0A1Y2A6Y2_9PLEO|nr:hypothetical protein BCR34DRAFT_341271 [Clohesyomyces aquaticus]
MRHVFYMQFTQSLILTASSAAQSMFCIHISDIAGIKRRRFEKYSPPSCTKSLQKLQTRLRRNISIRASGASGGWSWPTVRGQRYHCSTSTNRWPTKSAIWGAHRLPL